MGLTELVLGVGALGSATLGFAIYGFADARGTPLPQREHVWPATGVLAFALGNRLGLPDNDQNFWVDGTFYTVGIGVIAAGCYGVGYATGHFTN